MDALIIIVFFTPLLLLLWALVRRANRIRREMVDRELRMQRLDNLNPATVQSVLERDHHTCQRCGTTERVGVDFVGETPEIERAFTADDLEASCAMCFFQRWNTLQSTAELEEESIESREGSGRV